MRGFKTVAALAKAGKLDLNSLYGYLGLKKAPLTKNGNWKGSALRLAKTLRLPPDSLFPEPHLQEALARNTGVFEIRSDELRLLVAPEPVHAREGHMRA